MKKVIAIALITALTALSANAQFYTPGNKKKVKPTLKQEDFNPSWFVNFQAGAQFPGTPGMGSIISPVFTLNLGRNIIPIASARVGIEGVKSKVHDQYTGEIKKFQYVTGSGDCLLNISNCIAYRERPVNFFLVAGVGLNWSGMKTTNSSQFSPNVRIGGLADWRLNRNLALNLEVRADNTNDQFNGRLENGTHDWYGSVLFGLSLVLPDVKPIIQKEDNSAEIAALNDMINMLRSENAELRNRKSKVEVKTVEVEKKVVERIAVLPFVFFDCAKTTINKQQALNVKAIADYMKSNKETTVTITGYASPEGKPELNQKLSEERAKAVADMLINKYGIDADRITTAAGGATCDILPEADLNRVCVSVAK